MRFLAPLAIATATAFTAYTLPARANPGPSVNLVRINRDGVTPLPNVVDAIDNLNEQQRQEILISQAIASNEEVDILASGRQDFEIDFGGAIPPGLTGTLLLQRVNRETLAAETVEEIPYSRVRFSSDRTQMIIPHDRRVRSGERLCVVFPDELVSQLPERTSARCFEVRRVAAWWIIPLAVAAAVGIGLAIGSSDDDGDGGGDGVPTPR